MKPIYLQKTSQGIQTCSQSLSPLYNFILNLQFHQLNSFSLASSELWNDLPLHVKNSQTLAQFNSLLRGDYCMHFAHRP